jgi:hypothetical protein
MSGECTSISLIVIPPVDDPTIDDPMIERAARHIVSIPMTVPKLSLPAK